MRFSHLLVLGLILATWAIATSVGHFSPLILPSPKAVGDAIISLLFVEHSLWLHLGLTSYRTLASFALSCLVGIPLGLLMGFVPAIYRSLDFIVEFFRSIPPVALFPLFLLFLGLGELSKLGVPFYGCTLVLIINSVYGVLNVPKLRRTVAMIYGFSNWQLFWKIIVPDALPQIFVGMRTAVSLALMLTVVVEMLFGSANGIGNRVLEYHLLFETPKMYASIIVLGTLGYVINKCFVLIERFVVHWPGK